MRSFTRSIESMGVPFSLGYAMLLPSMINGDVCLVGGTAFLK